MPRTRQHIIADLAINHGERQVRLAGHVVEKRTHDYGIDLVMYTFDEDGEAEPGSVLMQVKSTDFVRLVGHGDTIAVRAHRSHIVQWLKETAPVALIVYDAAADVAYWAPVQRSEFPELTDLPTPLIGRVTTHIPVANVFNPEAVMSIVQVKRSTR